MGSWSRISALWTPLRSTTNKALARPVAIQQTSTTQPPFLAVEVDEVLPASCAGDGDGEQSALFDFAVLEDVLFLGRVSGGCRSVVRDDETHAAPVDLFAPRIVGLGGTVTAVLHPDRTSGLHPTNPPDQPSLDHSTAILLQPQMPWEYSNASSNPTGTSKPSVRAKSEIYRPTTDHLRDTG
ncbi:hypothetical protein CONLIGDRAFT_694064 [Coniochaeta ligniaria NRRL 30616]|uniref:Uncharacterized protein n=1 Tax=Coniochaeta ligniaria NRRL 30616 TaxID=1408157 RepID=A0A1J7I6Q2_9PEZI|nr:hypothetical protein CONLIGDRAFT_694064 [Coniochaeta ligniaria NRRL 30616]